MVGMVMAPVVMTLEMTLPLMEPMKPLLTTDTLAGPPRYLPMSAKARSMKKSPPPVICSTQPKNRKPMTSLAKILVGVPVMPSLPMMRYLTVWGKSKPMPEIREGRKGATRG